MVPGHTTQGHMMGRVPEKCFFLSSFIDCFLLTPISQATWERDRLERLNTQISRICRLSCTVNKSLVSDLQLRTSRPERCYIFLPTFPSWRWGRQSEVASPQHATSSPCHASHRQHSGVSESKKGKIQTSAFFGGGRKGTCLQQQKHTAYYYCMKLKGPEIPFMSAVFYVDQQGRRKESPHDQRTCLCCRLFCVVNIHVNCTVCLKYWCS